MRFYTEQHQYYGGINLHSKEMYVCILDKNGVIKLHRKIKANPDNFLKVIAPFREGLVVSAELCNADFKV